MKLVRFGERGVEKPGLLGPAGEVRDLSGLVSDIDAGVLSPAGLSRLAATLCLVAFGSGFTWGSSLIRW